MTSNNISMLMKEFFGILTFYEFIKYDNFKLCRIKKSPAVNCILILIIMFIPGCFGGSNLRTEPSTYAAANQNTAVKPSVSSTQNNIGYSIQVGAFSNAGNAANYSNSLNRKVDSFYFRGKDSLYKVRFGNYASRAVAEKKAKELKSSGLIKSYFIISPQYNTIAKKETRGEDYVRNEIVATAKRFLGTPYKWGGTSSKSGFDCSGLAMSVYRLNGINLPRSSKLQSKAGKYISRKKLQKGDLVFFATQGGKKVSHVGIYIGNNNFIHAASTGQRVKISKLSNTYYVKHYVSGRTYI